MDSRAGGTYPFEQYSYSATSGNLASKAGVSYTYNAQVSGCQGGSRTIPHAVSQAGAVTYTYDCNGNMTVRNYGGGGVYNLSYDADLPALPLPALPAAKQARRQAGNRLTAVRDATIADFIYDGDGNRVKGTVGGVTTIYIGNYAEWMVSSSTLVKYYYAGTTRIAMCQGSTLNWLIGDYLGSTSAVANENGSASPTQLYKPWGEKRYPTGAAGCRPHIG